MRSRRETEAMRQIGVIWGRLMHQDPWEGLAYAAKW